NLPSQWLVLCVILVSGQSVAQDCNELERKCRSCVRSLNNSNDRRLPTLNGECRQKLRRTWLWRDVDRCEVTKLECLGWESRMNCADIARMAGMARIR
ncbi:hypothetical protein KR009_009352, partial [Drosophila setifemur]